MRYFILLDFQHMVLAFFLGLLAALFVYIAWRGYPAREADEASHDNQNGSHGAPAPPFPPLLVFILVGAILWLIAYAVLQGIYGGPIS